MLDVPVPQIILNGSGIMPVRCQVVTERMPQLGQMGKKRAQSRAKHHQNAMDLPDLPGAGAVTKDSRMDCNPNSNRSLKGLLCANRPDRGPVHRQVSDVTRRNGCPVPNYPNGCDTIG